MRTDAFDLGIDDFDVDLSQMDADRPPAGIAVVQVMDVSKGRSRANNPQWIWTLRVVEYREGPTDMDCSALRPLDYYTAITRAALWKVDEIVQALGLQKNAEGKVKFSREQVQGVLMLASLKEGEFNGRPQTNIEALRAYPEPGKKAEIPDSFTKSVAGGDPFGGGGAGGDIPF